MFGSKERSFRVAHDPITAKSDRTGNAPAGLWPFLMANKRWWLLPLLVVFALFVLLILMTLFGDEHAVDTGLGSRTHCSSDQFS
jgi:hypothetical protein